MKKLSYVATSVLLAVLCALLVLSAIFCLTSAFSIHAPSSLTLLIFACCAVFCFLFGWKHGWIAFLASAALLLAGVFVYLEPLKKAFSVLVNYLLGIYNSGYHWFADPGFLDSVSSAEIKPALIFLGVTLSMLVSFSAAYLKSTLLCGLTVLPCIVSCFVVTDTPPENIWLLLALGCIILLAMTQQRRKTDTLCAPVSMLYFAIPTVLLLGILCLASPQSRYDHDALVGGITEKINTAWEGVRGNFLPTGAILTPDTVDLHAQKDAPSSNRTVMRVTAEQDGTVYLCGMAYTGFAGDTWSVAVYPREPQPKYSAISVLPQQLTVSTVNASDILYVPYGLTQCDADTANYDAYRENGQGLKDYTVLYYPTDSMGFWISPTEAYLQYAFENCISLPEDTRQALLAWGEDHLPENPTPQQIAEAVSQSATYSRHPRAFPADEDIAVYFLNEAESGFCIHFATATAELLRAYGYPSRYVTGYVAGAEAGQTVSVPEKNAHAWAEYYEADLGWVKLESTPAEGVQPETDETQSGQQTTVEPAEPTQPSQPGKTPTNKVDPTKPGKKETDRHLPVWGWLLLALAAALLALIARRAILQSLRNKQLQKGSANAKLCAAWRYYTKLCKLTGAPEKEDLFTLAQKAKYSQYRTTEEELAQMNNALTQQLDWLKKAPLHKRLYCKYILAVI